MKHNFNVTRLDDHVVVEINDEQYIMHYNEAYEFSRDIEKVALDTGLNNG